MNLGGTEKSFLNLLEVLPKGTQVDLLLLEKKGALLEKVPNHVKIIEIKNAPILNDFFRLGSRRFGLLQLKQGNLLLGFKSLLAFIFEKLKITKNSFWVMEDLVTSSHKKYDVSIAYAGVHNFIAWYVLKKTNATKKVLWVHFDIEKVVKNFSFGKHYYQEFDQIFNVSEKGRNTFNENFPSTLNKNFTFNNIIPIDKIKSEADAGESYSDSFKGIRILTLGRLSKEKGQDMIPYVVSKLRCEGFNFRWYLIGEGNLENEITSLIESYGIEDNLILLGRKNNPYAYLKDSDIYVQTSHYEGDPVVIREALAFRKPIVSTAFSTVENLLIKGENALITEISENGIYEGVKMLLMDEKLRERFSQKVDLVLNYEENIKMLIE